jgi:hypothetical protein
MKFNEIASRITGISCPVFGISWNPPEAEVSIARRVITYLEDRRVLYDPCQVEIPRYCVESIIQIREFLTNELARINQPNEFSASLRAIRAACRKFLTRIQGNGGDIVSYANHRGHFASWIFYDALGQLRGVFGIHIAQLAVRHGLDIEDDLAQILPESTDADCKDSIANKSLQRTPPTGRRR